MTTYYIHPKDEQEYNEIREFFDLKEYLYGFGMGIFVIEHINGCATIKECKHTIDFAYTKFTPFEDYKAMVNYQSIDCVESLHTTPLSITNNDKVTSQDIINVSKNKFTDKHYDCFYTLTEEDIKEGKIKVDAYFVADCWKIGEKDNTGCVFHILKTLQRWGVKNTIEREVSAVFSTIKRYAQIKGVKL